VDEASGDHDRSALFDRDRDELDRQPRSRDVDPSTRSRH
jgi:hypothetical protein